MSQADNILTIARKLYEQRMDPRDITSTRINERFGTDRLSEFLQQRYSSRQREIKVGYNLKPPYMALLREEVTGRIPFLRERAGYRCFKPSREDWVRFVKLPLDITPKVAEWFGICYLKSDESNPSVYITVDGHHYYLRLYGRNENLQFYRQFIAPLIKDIHNLEVNVQSHDSTLEGKKYPLITIGSQAIVTWLTLDIGLPQMPSLQPYLQPFFFDAAFSIGARPINGKMHVYANKKTHDLFKLAKSLGFNPDEKQDHLEFSLEDIKKMRLLNPYHINLSLLEV